MMCVVCANPILKNEEYASEETMFKGIGKTFRQSLTGRKAHVVCLEGKQYDEAQLTLDDYIGKEERT